ncbi:hypothetical protein KP509_03G010200 [Ceratopteris richardii]|uniref:Uncharacterized protein n=1 Tax=Ceratopteris richardii TaxID=49495 RepID=A0A8T2UX24_CERRI|nr:hypothetical protein KP509_03G010200 [Ceratopteris richardii]
MAGERGRRDGGGLQTLPHASSLSPNLRALLNHHFKSIGDLENARPLLASLSSDLQTSERRSSELQSSIASILATWTSTSHSASSSLSSLRLKLQDLPPNASVVPARFDAHEDLVGQLPLLAAEVSRIERVRQYAEIALRLEALVGDLEDLVTSIVLGASQIKLPRKMANSPSVDVLIDLSSKLSSAAYSFQKIENVIGEVITSWPNWKRLVMAVDVRVDSALASLKPSALADYRSKLQSIGWPPALMPSAQEGEGRSVQLDNPLLLLHGEMQKEFENSFISLSVLQASQCCRRARKTLNGSKTSPGIFRQSQDHELLWAIDELVAPIKERVTHHFLKWSDKPDLIFGLVHRLAQQHTKIVDVVLQPMLDRAKLTGYSIREEWLSALTKMVMQHLRDHILAELATKLLNDRHNEEIASLWLYIVDSTISFDKKMSSLALQSIVSTSKMENSSFEESVSDFQPIVRCLSVFADQAEWLELWAHLELHDTQKKLNNELQNDSSWSLAGHSALMISSAPPDSVTPQEDYRHPAAAEIAMRRMWALINRCRSLPEHRWQLEFILQVGASYINTFLAKMLQRCQEAEALTALAEDNAVRTVVSCINCACFCEHKLHEWGDDIFFLNLRQLQALLAMDQSNASILGLTQTESMLAPFQGCVFDGEISSLARFRSEWLQKLVLATQRSLDANCQEYIRNKKSWQEESTENGLTGDITVSVGLIEGLSVLQAQMNLLENVLGDTAFMDYWRSLASSLDQFFLHAVVLGGAKFSSYGSLKLSKDVKALCQVFKPFCIRPASFFPNLSDAVLLLELPREDGQQLQKELVPASNWRFRDHGDESKLTSLKLYGIKTITPAMAGKILAQRFFSKI